MKNNYGLDSEYFKKKLKLIVRDCDNYRPSEMYNSLSALMDVALQQHREVNDGWTLNERSDL